MSTTIAKARVFPYDFEGRTAWCARCTADGFEHSVHAASPALAMNALESGVGRIVWVAKPDPDAVPGEMVGREEVES